jgi:hypothetical protein
VSSGCEIREAGWGSKQIISKVPKKILAYIVSALIFALPNPEGYIGTGL